MNPVLVNVLRGETVESTHRGAVAVLDADGAVITSIGDIDRPIFPRSAVKVLQALPLVASGAADRLDLTDDELALACASHNGEPLHAQTAAAMLAKAGLDHTALECGNNARACEVAMAAVIEVFVALDNAQAQFMRTLRDVTLANWNGLEVGRWNGAPARTALEHSID